MAVTSAQPLAAVDAARSAASLGSADCLHSTAVYLEHTLPGVQEHARCFARDGGKGAAATSRR